MLDPNRHTCLCPASVQKSCCVLWSLHPVCPCMLETQISLYPSSPCPLLHASVWTKVSLYFLADCPDFSSYSTMKGSLLSPVVLFIFSSQDKTHHQLLSGVTEWHLSKVIQMADVHTVSFLRLEILASVLVNVSDTCVCKTLFDSSHFRIFFPQNVVPNRWFCGGLRILTGV